MKNIIVVNFQNKRKYPFERLEKEMRMQIENSLQLGWKPEDVWVITNFDYEFMGVRSINIKLNDFCLTGSKMFAMQHLLNNNMIEGKVWVHDLDLFQVSPFDEDPEFKDIGISTYSKPKFNGGSVFYKPSAKDIVNETIEEIIKVRSEKEEPIIERVFKSSKNRDRVTVMNCRYNVGCSGYKERVARSKKPIIAIHGHPTNRISFDSHYRDRNRLGEVPTTKLLYDLALKYFGDEIKNFRYLGERGYDGSHVPPEHILKQWEK